LVEKTPWVGTTASFISIDQHQDTPKVIINSIDAAFEGYWDVKITSELLPSTHKAEFTFRIFMHAAPCLRNLTSFKNVVTGAALTSKINDWAFEIGENAINAPNHFSSYRSSDANCKIKYSLAWKSTTNRPSGAVET
jgi:hypothetical protein